jgi:hypothetical protein
MAMPVPSELIAKLTECGNANFAGVRDSWFFWQSVFSKCVIGGLVLEGPELTYDMLHIVRSRVRRFRYTIVLLESRIELAKVAAFIGWIFIIVGLFGELEAASRIQDLSTSIQECSDIKVAVALLQASEANKKAESEALARAEIEAKVAWRSLALAQKNEIGLTLRHFGKLTVAVGYEGTDAESSSFASDIADALAATRTLKVVPEEGMLHVETPMIRKGHIIPGMATGVLVAPTEDTACKSLASAIAKELNDRGFDARVGFPEKRPLPQVRVDVGPRPTGPQGEYKLQAERDARTKNKNSQNAKP